MASLDVITLGCRLNTYESEVMRQNAQKAGIEDMIIINTCAVTQEAERKACQTIRKFSRTRPGVPMVVTGCAAQINKEKFLAIPGVSVVLGNAEKMSQEIFKKLPSLLSRSSTPQEFVSDIKTQDHLSLPLVSHYEGMAKAFVEIQNGCNHSCTFCTIPKGRGKNRSLPVGQIVNHIQHLVHKGFKEVSLTGVDITSFGQDLPGKPTLANALRRLLKMVPDLPRLRLSSLDPNCIDDDLLRLFEQEERLMPHVHLSIQSGSTMILKRMKRRHQRDDIFLVCEKLRRLRSDVVFGGDFIAGFPTESKTHFQETVDLIESIGITFLHIFPYSARPGTPAERMPQVAPDVIRERAAHLRSLGKKNQRNYLNSLMNTSTEVLVESTSLGRTPGYATVNINATPLQVGTLQKVSLHKGPLAHHLYGTFLEKTLPRVE